MPPLRICFPIEAVDDGLVVSRLHLFTPSLFITYYCISTDCPNITTTIQFIPILTMEVELSTLAAKSALHSTKRARILYDVNPQTVFLPSADPAITAASIARRRRRLPPKATHHDGIKSSTALTVVTDSATKAVPDGSQPTTNISSALIRTSDVGSEEPKPGGILVVRSIVAKRKQHSSFGLVGKARTRDQIMCFIPVHFILHSQFFCPFCLLFFPCLEIKIGLQQQSQNPNSDLACTMETCHSAIVPFRMGSKYCHGSHQ